MLLRIGSRIVGLSVLIMVLVMGGMGWAATFNVKTAGELTTALTTAQSNGAHDTIRLARGTYAGNFSYLPVPGENFDLTVQGGWSSDFSARILDPTNTILDAGESGNVLSLNAQINNTNGSLTVEGITVRNGYLNSPGGSGSGLSVHTRPPGMVTLNKNIIENNKSYFAASGIYAQSRDAGTQAGGTVVISNNIIRNNETAIGQAGGGAGIFIYGASLTSIQNNLIYGNKSGKGQTSQVGHSAGIYLPSYNGEVRIINNTIVGNQGTTEGGGVYLQANTGGWGSSQFKLYNNIIRENSTDSGIGQDIYNNVTTIGSSLEIAHSNYNDLDSIAGAVLPDISNGNLDLLPQFRGAEDYRLAAGSPCQDAGENSPPGGLPARDLDYRVRLQNGTVDMGSYETPLDNTIYVTSDGTGNGVSPSSPSSLQNALTTAQSNGLDDIIRVARGTYPGNFVFDQALGENFNLTIEGGWDTGFTARTLEPLNTTLNGNNTGRVLSLLASNGTTGHIRLEGFNLINGRVLTDANFGGGLLLRTYPPGNVTVNKNIFDNNFAETRGGGLALDTGASITLSNNIIKNNLSGPDTGGNLNLPFAGGAYVICSNHCSVINNLIYNNISDDSLGGGGGGKGGGIMVLGSGEIFIVNNTITGNDAYTFGGGIYLGGGASASHFYLYNNIIRGNTLTYGGWRGDQDIQNAVCEANPPLGHSVLIAYSDYEFLGDWTCSIIPTLQNNINLNPQFVAPGDYHLQAVSPVIDTGTHVIAGFAFPLLDLEGRKRIIDGKLSEPPTTPTVDMGAYEYDPLPNKLDLPLILRN